MLLERGAGRRGLDGGAIGEGMGHPPVFPSSG
jgi:hypothetical protein